MAPAKNDDSTRCVKNRRRNSQPVRTPNTRSCSITRHNTSSALDRNRSTRVNEVRSKLSSCLSQRINSQTSPKELGRTRSQLELRGRRTLKCKNCEFSCSNTQEFTQHQNTAHAKGKERKESRTQTCLQTKSPKQKVGTVNVIDNQALVEKSDTPDCAQESLETETSPHGQSQNRETNNSSNSSSKTLTEQQSPPDQVDNIEATQSSSIVQNSSAIVAVLESDFQEKAKTLPDNTPAHTIETNITEREKSVGSTSPLDATMITTISDTMQDTVNVSGDSHDEHNLSDGEDCLVIDDKSPENISMVVSTPHQNTQNHMYRCEECAFTTTSAKESLRHRKDKHNPDMDIFECSICDYVTESRQKLQFHQAEHFSPSSGAENEDQDASKTEAAKAVKRSHEEAGLTLPLLVQSTNEEGEEDGEDAESDAGSITPPPSSDKHQREHGEVGMLPKKKRRKDVSPEKYFQIAEDHALNKFGCSRCGKIYKWKKSLNKHWKEKHGTDPGDNLYTPPGMQILLEKNSHEQTEYRLCCNKGYLSRLTVSRNYEVHSVNTLSQAHVPSPQDDEMDGEIPLTFLGTSHQPIFPSSGHHLSNTPKNQVLSKSDITDQKSVDGTCTPPAFSEQTHGQQVSASSGRPTSTVNGSSPLLRQNGAAEEIDRDCNPTQAPFSKQVMHLKIHKDEMVVAAESNNNSLSAVPLPTSSNKRTARCGVCQKCFHTFQALNEHFGEYHLDIITEHKKAIQKIPHGLQQTCYLLKTPLQNISKLYFEECDDPLKCSMCDFTAKWPAELQKHAVSHSEARPHKCMVCSFTYKYKWDLVKHFVKAHADLPNPYKRHDPSSAETSHSGNSELQANQVDSNSYSSSEIEEGEVTEIEEGEITPTAVKTSVGNRGVEMLDSLLQDQAASSQDKMNVESKRQISPAGSTLQSHQPDSSDGPGDSHPSTSTGLFPSTQNGGDGVLTEKSPENSKMPINNNHLTSVFQSKGLKMVVTKNKTDHQNGLSRRYFPYSLKTQGNVKPTNNNNGESSDLKFKCEFCDYKARRCSDIQKHAVKHSLEKRFGCSNCSYRSRWKWDVAKHLKHCGSGGTIKDIVCHSERSNGSHEAPPNVMVTPEGNMIQAQEIMNLNNNDNSARKQIDSQPPVATVSQDGQISLLKTPVIISVPSSDSPVHTPLESQMNTQANSQQVNLATDNLGSSGPSNDGRHHSLSTGIPNNCLADVHPQQTSHPEKSFSSDMHVYTTCKKSNQEKHEKQKQSNTQIISNNNTNGVDKEMKKCSFCKFQTNSREALQNHTKKYHPGLLSSSRKPALVHPNFKCRCCQFTSNTLEEYVEHRKIHLSEKDHDDSKSSVVFNGGQELDEARLKHPRKNNKRYKCNKCNFLCMKNTELLHHQKEFHNFHECPWCIEVSETKDEFLDHLVAHPEFNPAEWEFFFRNEEDAINNSDVGGDKSKTLVSLINSSFAANTIKPTVQHSSPQLIASHASSRGQNLPCQWCGKVFRNVVVLEAHGRKFHPDQMRELEQTEQLNESFSSHLDNIIQSQYGDKQLISHQVRGSNTHREQKVNGNISGADAELVASKTTNTCDVPTLMAQLCKVKALSPPQQLNTPSQPKVVFSSNTKVGVTEQPQVHNITQQQRFCSGQQKSSASSSTSLHAKDLSKGEDQQKAGKESAAGQTDVRSSSVPLESKGSGIIPTPKNSNTTIHQGKANKEVFEWVHKKTVLTFSGNPLEPLVIGTQVLYKCVLCNFINCDPAKVDKHTKEYHIFPKKYQCGHCWQDFSKLHQVLTHQQSLHPDMQLNIIELCFQEIGKELFESQSSLQTCSPVLFKSEAEDLHAEHHGKCYSCDHCPFSTDAKSEMIEHTKEHDNTGNCNLEGFTELADPRLRISPSSVNLSSQPLLKKPEVGSSFLSKSSVPVYEQSDSVPLDLSVEMTEKKLPEIVRSERKDAGKPSNNYLKNKKLSQSVGHMTADQKAQAVMEAESDCQLDVIGDSLALAAADKDNGQILLTCKHCPFSCSEHFAYRTHCRHHGLKGRYPCDFCTFSHNELQVLTEHRFLHRHEDGFTASYNPPPSPTQTQDEKSASDTSSSTSRASVPKTWVCKDCLYKSKNEEEFKVHCGMHGQMKRYICDFCNWSDDSLVMVVDHRKIHSNDPDFDHVPEDNIFLNDEYAKDASTSGEFKAKLLDTGATSRSPVLASCDSKTPPFKLSLTMRIYSCVHCPFVTSSRSGQEYHLALHNGLGCYTCEQCTYRTDRWSLMCQHDYLHKQAKRNPGTSPKDSPAPQACRQLDFQDHSDQATCEIIKVEEKETANRKTSEVMNSHQAMEMASNSVPPTTSTQNCSESTEFCLVLYSGDLSSSSLEGSDGTDSELRCHHCPFTSSSDVKLARHLKHHPGTGSLECMCCNYTCSTVKKLHTHLQLHFPGAHVDMDKLTQILALQKDTVEFASNTARQESRKGANTNVLTGDSSIQENRSVSDCLSALRMYVCRYCEREFQAKESLIQHEQQHPVNREKLCLNF